MFCENLQFNLSLYLDDHLTGEERVVLDRHLAQCPLCRQKLADFQALRNNLRVLPRPEFSGELLDSVRKTVAAELQSVETSPIFIFTDKVQNWVQMRLVPYAVGTAASLVLGVSLLWAIFLGIPVHQPDNGFRKYDSSEKTMIMLANANPKGTSDSDEYPEISLPISNATPTVNPSGALIALTKSFVRGEMKDDEVVVVADVFGNGLAQIAEVVEPINDWKTVNRLEKALKEDPDYAPFVPAKVDHRSDTVRVIFKIQRVDVETGKKRNR